MKKLLFTLLIGVSLIFGINSINAKEINHFYSNANENITLDETINGDSALAGQNIDLKGDIQGIGFMAGETITHEGKSLYGFIAGNNINIKGEIEKSLYIAGNNIIFDKNAKIGNDAQIAGENITLEGQINRDINGYASNIVIKEGTTIKGNINLNANKITIENNVIINGTLKYNEDATISIKNKDNIGKIKTTKAEIEKKVDTKKLVSSMINIIIVFLVLVILLPKTVEKTTTNYLNKNLTGYLRSMGTGILLLICIPIICLMLLISNIGVALGLITSCIYIIGLYLSYIYSGVIFGNLLLVKLLKLNSNKYLSGIIGILLIKVLSIIPIIGVIVSVVAIIIGLDAIYRLIFTEKKKKEKK